MLNITRRRGERIVLGDDVFISVLEVSGQTVRLGIEAPRSVRVYREEIWLEVKRENEAAARAAEAALPSEVPPVPERSPGAARAVIARPAPGDPSPAGRAPGE
ncbi:MAG TPA: carbon storage regulator CsrA [Solirubrobacteraceae bacterium]|nr:carbon storage regulator CsrA [Solirubrobacteraceae bacterium]